MKRKIFLIGVLILVLILLVVGCAAKSGSNSDGWYGEDAAAPPYEDDRRGGDWDYQEGVKEDAGRPSTQVGASDGAVSQRYAIFTGEIDVNVEDIKESERKIRQFVEGKGGFISSSNSYSDPRGEYQNSYLTIRVPQEHFGTTMAFLEEDLGKWTHRNAGESDVTLQYVDMEARINNLTRQEIRYTEILDDAETVEEILQIERELVRIRGDIESLTAQFIHLKDRVSLATISITLRQTVLATPGVTAAGFEGAWNRARVALTESLNMLINGAANFFVFSFRALPFAIIMLAAVFAIFKVLKRFDRRSPQGPQ